MIIVRAALSITVIAAIGGTNASFAQQRPLLTEDVDTPEAGVIRIESGFEFLQDQRFPLSGLKGDLTKLADTRLSFGVARKVAFQIEWTAQNLLSIDERTESHIPLKLGDNDADTNDVGDVRLWMKMKFRDETAAIPAFGFRFGVQLPNSDQSKGIGTNTTDFFAMIAVGKKAAEGKLNLFGNLGLGILQAPLANFTQNDVLLYGVAGIYDVSEAISLVAEANGFHSTRSRAPIGTEDFSTARVGAQVKGLGVKWTLAGVFGLSARAPRTGFALGITYDWKAF